MVGLSSWNQLTWDITDLDCVFNSQAPRTPKFQTGTYRKYHLHTFPQTGVPIYAA